MSCFYIGLQPWVNIHLSDPGLQTYSEKTQQPEAVAAAAKENPGKKSAWQNGAPWQQKRADN